MEQETINAIADAVAERILRDLPRGRVPITPEYLTAEQVVQTTDYQLLRLREVTARAGFRIVAEYVETASGAVGRKPRAQLDVMMEDAARRKFDILLAWDVSRLSRSLNQLVGLFETLRALSIDLILEQQGVDTSTPAGRALLQMSGVFAEFKRAMIVERTKAGLCAPG